MVQGIQNKVELRQYFWIYSTQAMDATQPCFSYRTQLEDFILSLKSKKGKYFLSFAFQRFTCLAVSNQLFSEWKSITLENSPWSLSLTLGKKTKETGGVGSLKSTTGLNRTFLPTRAGQESASFTVDEDITFRVITLK